MKPAANERMLYCPECGNLEYPKISPAVIVAVTDGDRILMSKYAGRAFKKYALLAGFAEIGETLSLIHIYIAANTAIWVIVFVLTFMMIPPVGLSGCIKKALRSVYLRAQY